MTSNLFSFSTGSCREIPLVPIHHEEHLHRLISANLFQLLGVTLLKNEFVIGADKSRIDTLGIDTHGCPVIIEFKVAQDSGVINQVLYYTSWINANRSVFEALVSQHPEPLPEIDWSGLRSICIAKSFSVYDIPAVSQMNVNIDLISYQAYDNNILALNTECSQRKKDFMSQNLASQAMKVMGLDAMMAQMSAESLSFIDQLKKEIYELGHEVMIIKREQEWIVTAFEDIARIYISSGKYPKPRIELIGDVPDVWDLVRHKKTSRGIDFFVNDEKSLKLAIELLSDIYSRVTRCD